MQSAILATWTSVARQWTKKRSHVPSKLRSQNHNSGRLFCLQLETQITNHCLLSSFLWSRHCKRAWEPPGWWQQPNHKVEAETNLSTSDRSVSLSADLTPSCTAQKNLKRAAQLRSFFFSADIYRCAGGVRGRKTPFAGMYDSFSFFLSHKQIPLSLLGPVTTIFAMPWRRNTTRGSKDENDLERHRNEMDRKCQKTDKGWKRDCIERTDLD